MDARRRRGGLSCNPRRLAPHALVRDGPDGSGPGARRPVTSSTTSSIQVATVNGSGSQTANLVLLRSIFHMGVPVSGKNLFPSNIAGLPTWYTIRANRHGYIGRKKEIDVLVAMNAETAQDDVRGAAAGAAVVYDEPLERCAPSATTSCSTRCRSTSSWPAS